MIPEPDDSGFPRTRVEWHPLLPEPPGFRDPAGITIGPSYLSPHRPPAPKDGPADDRSPNEDN